MKPLTIKQEKFAQLVADGKTCQSCNQNIHISLFAKDKTSLDGLQRKCKLCNAKYRQENKDKRTQYLQDNKEKLSKQNKEYIEKNLERRKEYKKEYREINKKEISKYNSEYAKSEKGKLHNRQNVRRHRTLQKDGDITSKQLVELVLTQSKCYWCGVEHNGIYHLDHYYPLSKGGKHTISNIVISCPSCNIGKRDTDPHKYAIKHGRLA